MLADLIIKVAGMEREERQAYRPRPSLAGPERCVRQLVYWGAGVPEDRPMQDRFVLVLDDSSWHEHLTVDWIAKTAYRIHSQQMEVKIAGSGIELSGHIDGVITDVLGVDRLFEHKGINHFSFQRYAGGIPPQDYIAQCCLYIAGLQQVNPNITEAVLLMKNKNTAQYLEFIVRYDRKTDEASIPSVAISSGEVAPITETFPNVVRSAFDKFALVRDHIADKSLPPRPYAYGTDFPCGYCGWQETCWSGYLGEVQALTENEADLSELADTARYYNELGAQIRDMGKERDELAQAIKDRLTELNARRGRAGEYLIDWQAREETRLKKREDIPPALLPQVTQTAIKEVLYVKTVKKTAKKEAA